MDLQPEVAFVMEWELANRDLKDFFFSQQELLELEGLGQSGIEPPTFRIVA